MGKTKRQRRRTTKRRMRGEEEMGEEKKKKEESEEGEKEMGGRGEGRGGALYPSAWIVLEFLSDLRQRTHSTSPLPPTPPSSLLPSLPPSDAPRDFIQCRLCIQHLIKSSRRKGASIAEPWEKVGMGVG